MFQRLQDLVRVDLLIRLVPRDSIIWPELCPPSAKLVCEQAFTFLTLLVKDRFHSVAPCHKALGRSERFRLRLVRRSNLFL